MSSQIPKINFPDKRGKLKPMEIASLFAEIMAAYERVVHAMVYKITGDYHATCDIVQETFIKLHDHLHQTRADARVIIWCRSVARNGALRFISSQNKRRDAEITLADVDIIDPYAWNSDEAEFCAHIAAALEKFPARQQAIFELRVFEKMSFAEIGRDLDSTAQAVRKDYQRTRQKLLGLLD